MEQKRSVGGELYQLIHGLSAAEKRYFRIFTAKSAGRHHGNYLKLFEILAGMADFDPTALRSQVRDEAFARHLSPTQSRLMTLILQSLRAKEEKSHLDDELTARLAQVRILLRRGLWLGAARRLQQLKEKARACEDHLLVLRLIAMEVEAFGERGKEKPADFFARLEQERATCMALLTQSNVLHMLHTRLRALTHAQTYHRRRKSKVQAEIEALLAHPALLAEAPTGSVLAFTYHQNCWAIDALRKGNFGAAVPIYTDILQKWETATNLRHNHISLYLGLVNNFLTAVIFATQVDANFLDSIAKIRNTRGLPPAGQIKLDRIVFIHELNYHTNFGTYASGKSVIDRLIPWLDQHQAHITHRRYLMFQYNMASFFFAYGKFSLANQHLHQILNAPRLAETQEIRDFARIFELLIQFELGNPELIDAFSAATYRSLKRRHQLSEYEQALIHYFQQVQKCIQPADFRAAAQTLQTQIQAIAPENELLLGKELIGIWLTSKLKDTPMAVEFQSVVQQQRPQEGW